MADLRGKILTIPEIEEALKEYGCDVKIPNAMLRKFLAVMDKQIIKTRNQTLDEVHGELLSMLDKLKNGVM
jgi:hypothetical protein